MQEIVHLGGDWYESVQPKLSETQIKDMKARVVMDIWQIDIQPNEIKKLLLTEEVFNEYLELFDWLIARCGNKNLLYIDHEMKVDPGIIDLHELSIVDANKNQQLFTTSEKIGMPIRDYLLWFRGADEPRPKILEEWSGIPRNRLHWVYERTVGMLKRYLTTA